MQESHREKKLLDLVSEIPEVLTLLWYYLYYLGLSFPFNIFYIFFCKGKNIITRKQLINFKVSFKCKIRLELLFSHFHQLSITPAMVREKLAPKSSVAMTLIPLNILIKHIVIDGREHELVPQIFGHLKSNSRIKNVAHLPWA